MNTEAGLKTQNVQIIIISICCLRLLVLSIFMQKKVLFGFKSAYLRSTFNEKDEKSNLKMRLFVLFLLLLLLFSPHEDRNGFSKK